MPADLHAVSPESLTALAIQRLSPGTVVDGKFVIRGMLGQGGMGLALRAWEPEWERDCVLKMLAPHMHARFRPEHDCADMLAKEAKTLAKLANIHSTAFVQVYGRGTVQLDVGGGDEALELPYYVMELLRGSTFQRLVVNRRSSKEKEFFAWKHVINAAHKLSAALSVAHSLGIIHRDLKPDNVFLHSLGHGHEVKIIDWGISTREGQPRRAGTGTVRYAAPELLKEGYRYESTQSDIYPLGLFIYELATLRGPFDGVGREALAYAHVWEQPAPLSKFRADAPPALVELVAAMLQKSPEKRPTAKAAATLLSELLFETLDGAGDSQIGDLLQGAAREGRGPAAVGSYPLPRAGSEPSRSAVSVEVLVSEPVVERVVGEAPRAAATVPVVTQKLPVKYPDTVPDAEPFGSTVNAAVTAPLGAPPDKPEGQLRVFQSTAEIFEAVWNDDTQYASSPLEAKPVEAVTSEVAASALEPTAPPLNEPTPGPLAERTSVPTRRDSSRGARRLAFGMVSLAAALTMFGVAVRVARLHAVRPQETATQLQPASGSSSVAAPLLAVTTPSDAGEAIVASRSDVTDAEADAVATPPMVARAPRASGRAPRLSAPKDAASDFPDPWAKSSKSPEQHDSLVREFDSVAHEPPPDASLGDLNLDITH